MLHEQICRICLSYMYHHSLEGWIKCPACSFMKKKGISMISAEEILMGRIKLEDLSPELSANLDDLLVKLNKFRAEYNIPMYVTSGYRSPEINANTPGASKTSAHMSCQAADFKDEDGKLLEFIKRNPGILDRCDLYLENPGWCPTWVHLQSRPASKRIFTPYTTEPTSPNRKI